MFQFLSGSARALAIVGAFLGSAVAASAHTQFGPPVVVGRAPWTMDYGCAPAPVMVVPPVIALPPLPVRLLRPGPVIVRPPIHRHWRDRHAYYGPGRTFLPAPRVFVR